MNSSVSKSFFYPQFLASAIAETSWIRTRPVGCSSRSRWLGGFNAWVLFVKWVFHFPCAVIKGEKQKKIEARTRSSFNQYFIIPQLPGGGGFKDLQCPRWWKWLQNDSQPPSAPTGNVKRSPAARIYTSALRLSEFGPAKLWGSERVLYFREMLAQLATLFPFWKTIPRHSRNAIFVKVTKNPFTTKAGSSARKVPRLNHGQRWKFQVGKPTGAKIAVQKLATHRWHGWINSPKFHGYNKGGS